MDKFIEKIKERILGVFTIHGIMRILLFLIPFVAIVIKSIIFQGFVVNRDPYLLDFGLGLASAKPFINYYYAFILIFLSFALLFKGKGRVIYLFIMDAIITALIVLDVTYFRGFYTMPSALLLTQTANLDNMGGTIMSMFSNMDFLFILDFIVLGIFVFFTRKSYHYC